MIKGYGVEKTRILERMYYYEKIIYYSAGSSDPVCSSTQMCFAEEPTTPPTVEQGEGEEGDEQTPPVNPASVDEPAGDNN